MRLNVYASTCQLGHCWGLGGESTLVDVSKGIGDSQKVIKKILECECVPVSLHVDVTRSGQR